MGKAPKSLDRPIAWVCRTYEENGKTEIEVIREGMSREEIIEAFPPYRSNALPFNRADLVKAIIYEAYQETLDGEKRERNNIRGFWYERIFHTLIRIMGEPGDDANINSIETTVNAAWGDLVEDGWLTYEDLNLYSEKERLWHVCVKPNSPYPTALVLVEKAALLEELRDIADTYEISFACAGGQDSRAAAMAYVKDLERLGIDLDQDFAVYSFADFDPEGWDIPAAAIEHLKLRITGNIRLVRLGLLKEQLGQSVIERQAIPYSLEADSRSARRGKATKYNRFIEETGGLFIPSASGQLVPGRVELNIYKPSQIRERILEGLAEHLDGFSYQVRGVKSYIADSWENGYWPQPDPADGVHEVYQPYFDAIESEREWIQVEEAKRAPEARRQKAELLAEYQRKIRELDAIIEEATIDLRARQRDLDALEGDLDKRVEREIDVLASEPLVESADYDSPDEAFIEIESNGGWRQWVEEQGITAIDSSALTEAANEHRCFEWKPDRDEAKILNDWIQEYLMPEIYYPDPEGPSETPEELIARALGWDIG